jgi:hypothetical protein
MVRHDSPPLSAVAMILLSFGLRSDPQYRRGSSSRTSGRIRKCFSEMVSGHGFGIPFTRHGYAMPLEAVLRPRIVKGIYFQWSNEPTNPVIRDWNVTQMRVSRIGGL